MTEYCFYCKKITNTSKLELPFLADIIEIVSCEECGVTLHKRTKKKRNK